MKQFVSLLLILAICFACCGQVLADTHDHLDHFVVTKQTYDEYGHTIEGYCSYCNIPLKGTDALHTFTIKKLTENDATYGCKLCSYENTIKLDSSNWLAALPDSAPLGQVNLPGATACTSKSTLIPGSAPKAYGQDYDIPNLLKMGTRILQTEITPDAWTRDIWKWYCTIPMAGLETWNRYNDRFTFSELAVEVSRFLIDHPTETVIIAFSVNHYDVCKDDVIKALNFYRPDADDPDQFIYYRSGDPIPTLGEVRGKCLLLCLNENNLVNKYAVSSYPNIARSDAYMDYELLGQAVHPQYNYGFRDAVQDYSRTDRVFCDEGYLVFTNQGQGNIRYIQAGAWIDDAHYDDDFSYWKEQRNVIENAKFKLGQRIGWVVFPFNSPKACENIYKSNLRAGKMIPDEVIWPETEPQVKHELPLTKWMAYMPDNTQLSQLNIPGTHDSGTASLYNAIVERGGQCQDDSIYEQLVNGSRLLDIRAGDRATDTWWNMWINHNGYECYKKGEGYTPLWLCHVMDDVTRFLEENPTETVIMDITQEGSDKEASIQNIRQMKKDLQAGKYERFDKFIFVDRGDKVPLLGDVRGKCIVYWDRDLGETASGADRTYNCYEPDWDWMWYSRLQHVQYALMDIYNPYLQDYDKRTDVFNNDGYHNLTRPGNPMIRFIGYNSNTVEKLKKLNIDDAYGPRAAFKEMKSGLEALVPSVGRRVGWIGMDFPTETMLRNIIDSNRLITTVASIRLKLPKLAEVSLPDNFARATLYYYMMGAFCDYDVATLGAEAWQLDKETGDYILCFRVYDDGDTNGQRTDFEVKFPDATDIPYNIYKTKDIPQDSMLIKNAHVHTIEWIVDLSGLDVSDSDLPSTGDTGHPFLWSVMMAVAATVVIMCAVSWKKEKMMH